MNIKGKVVLITGSSAGIGKSAALLFARKGAKVVVNCRSDIEAAKKAVDEIKSFGGEAIFIRSDVAKPGEVKKLFVEAMKAYGTLDILINNAGLASPKPFLDITEEDLIEEFRKNFFSMVYCSQEAAKIMKEKGGKIINVSSICALTGCTSVLTFSTSRSSVSAFTKSLAKILAPKITVNAVAPGYTNTRFWDDMTEKEKSDLINTTLTKKWVTPEEIARTFLFLANNDSITGQIITVDGGYTTSV